MNFNFKGKKLLQQALQLAHHGHSAMYERLEFLGDRVLGLVVSEMLFNAYPNEKEGALAKRFVALTREETLAEIAHLWQLNKQVITNEEDLKENNSILADVCEAVLGAIYLDQGLQAAKELIIPAWTPLMEANLDAPQDAKSACQEWAQKKYKVLPTYTFIEQTGTEHEPVFKMQVHVKKHIAFGFGRNKKAAEQDAAKNLLEQVK